MQMSPPAISVQVQPVLIVPELEHPSVSMVFPSSHYSFPIR